MSERDTLARVLIESCPLAILSAAVPWDALPEREREAWRMIAAAALAWRGPIDLATADLMTSVMARVTELATENVRLMARISQLELVARQGGGP